MYLATDCYFRYFKQEQQLVATTIHTGLCSTIKSISNTISTLWLHKPMLSQWHNVILTWSGKCHFNHCSSVTINLNYKRSSHWHCLCILELLYVILIHVYDLQLLALQTLLFCVVAPGTGIWEGIKPGTGQNRSN